MNQKLSARPLHLYGRTKTWILLITLVVAAGGWWLWKPSASDSGAPAQSGSAAGGRRFGGANAAQPVSVQAATLQDIRVTVSAIGSVAASNTAIVRAQVSGVLQSLNFKEGQQVKVGQWLAQIDPRAFQAALGQAEGALARDQALLDNDRIDLQRYRDLLAKDAAPKQQFDTQQALVRQLEGTVKIDQAAVDSARLQLSYTRVSAPIAGRVGLKQVDLGNVVQPADANGIAVITQTRPVALVFSVPAANVQLISARLRKGEIIPVQALERNGKTPLATGKVASLDNAIDPSTDTIKLKVLFANADDSLFPNQAVSIRLQLDLLKNVLTVPTAAVLRGAQGFYVYVVNADNSVSTRVITPGAVDGNAIAVQGALQVGEIIVVDGTDRLREGAKVEVIAADPRQRAGAAPNPGRRASAASASASSASAPERPGSAAAGDDGAARAHRMESLPPEMAEKLKTMSPDERRAWFQKRRQEAGTQGSAAN